MTVRCGWRSLREGRWIALPVQPIRAEPPTNEVALLS